MDTKLNGALKKLGLSDKDVRLYKASVQLGRATLPELSKVAKLQRSTAYLLVAELAKAGFLLPDHKSYKTQYIACEPEVLLQKLEAQQRQFGRTILGIKEALPDLRALYQTTAMRPRVRTFEGKAGVISIWKDILQTTQEVLLWTNQDSEKHIFDSIAHDQFIAERIRKQVPMRVLAINNESGAALTMNDAHSLRQTRTLPVSVQFTSETYIYGNKIAVLDFAHSVFGVITENDQIANSQRALFELTWSNLDAS